MSDNEHIEHTASPNGEEQQPAPNGKRKRLFLALLVTVLVLGAAYYAYYVLIASRSVTTDNAYVGADVAQVTPLVPGPVKQVNVSDTQTVKRGDILVVLDDADARHTLAQAEAAYDNARRKVESYIANDESLEARVSALTWTENAAEADLEKARIDLDRRKNLARSGSVSGDELTTAQNAFATAKARLASARSDRLSAEGSYKSNHALVAGAGVDDNPEVLSAKAALEQARLDLERTAIRAPINGVVSRRQVQVGQRVQPGAMLLVVVPIHQAYVDANFKEGQLAKVRAGQSVTLESDLYGGTVEYRGTVVGFSGGTGAAFSVVPAQNATGNWIKVVQRLPVRIALDAQQLAQHPLQVGLSMTATVDVSN